MAEPTNLTDSLNKLEEIVTWFDQQQDVDVEQGLTKVKEAATLIKDSKARLAEIENEFEAIEKEMNDGEDTSIVNDEPTQIEQETSNRFEDVDDKPIDLAEIPF